MPLLRYGLCLGSRRKRGLNHAHCNRLRQRARCAGKILEFDACRNQPGSLRAGGQAAQPRRIHLAPAERARMAYFSIQTQQHGAVQGRMRRFSGRDHAGFSVGPFRRAGRPAHRHRSNGQSHGRYLPAAAKRHPAGGRFTAASPACVPADKHRTQPNVQRTLPVPGCVHLWRPCTAY